VGVVLADAEDPGTWFGGGYVDGGRAIGTLELQVSTDSCDEYRFASSQESGGALGLTAADYIEVLAVQGANGQWFLWRAPGLQNKTLGTSRCLRGHVPNALSSGVGSALDAMYTNERMLIGDPYTVRVTN